MRKRVRTFRYDVVGRKVARKHFELFGNGKKQWKSSPEAVPPAKTVVTARNELPQVKLDHLVRLTDDVGILQHAKFVVPDRNHGYCTDDNARALVAVLMARDIAADSAPITDLACTYISFLHHALNQENGRFRNFMGYDRRWLEEVGSEDSHGRAIWGLGEAVALAESQDMRAAAQYVFDEALPAVIDFTSPRAWAFALVGIHAYLGRIDGDGEVRRVRDKLADKLLQQYRENATEDWPWIEDTVTYANGKISQALIISGRSLQELEMIQAGLESLEWLLNIQTDPQGHFVPIGNNGWYRRGGEKARFDQQPIEAQEIIEACCTAYGATDDQKWIAATQRCLDWFFGRNDRNVPLYDRRTGGCRDGLQSDGPNRNQGAESTLACILSLLNIHRLGYHETCMRYITEA